MSGKPASPAMAPYLEGHLLLKRAMAHRMGSRSQGTLPTSTGSFRQIAVPSPPGSVDLTRPLSRLNVPSLRTQSANGLSVGGQNRASAVCWVSRGCQIGSAQTGEEVQKGLGSDRSPFNQMVHSGRIHPSFPHEYEGLQMP